MKTCSICNIEKDDFSKNRNQCKVCRKLYEQNYFIKNKDLIAIKHKQYYNDNKKDLITKQRDYQNKHKDKKRANEKEWLKKRRKNDPIFRLRKNISRAVNAAINKNGESCIDYLGYTIDKLKEYLENQFKLWMTWENHGIYDLDTWDDNDQSTWTWNIDHIIPQSKLPYSSMEDENFNKCWALSNLRPYSAKQNNLDGNRREEEKQNETK